MELSFLGSTEYLLRAKLSIIFDSSKGLGIYLRKPVCRVSCVFFRIKDLEFLKIIPNFASASIPKPYLLVGVLGVWAYFMGKKRYLALCTWLFGIWQFHNNQSRTMQQWRSWVCYIRLSKSCEPIEACGLCGRIYTYGVGFGVARSYWLGNARASSRRTGNKGTPTYSMLKSKHFL